MDKKVGTVARLWRCYVRETKAVSALEYAILVGVIAVAIAGALAAFTTDLEEAFTAIGGAIDTPGPADLDIDP